MINNKNVVYEKNINKIIKICDYLKIKKYDICDDGYINVYEDVKINIKIKKLPIKFKEVFGDFICGDNIFVSLYGFPLIVHGNFICKNNSIKSLKYSPNEIGGFADFSNNKKLSKLINMPQNICGSIDFSNCSLKSLYGCNDDIKGSINISYNNFNNLKYGPVYVNNNFYSNNCGLKSLYGSPKWIGGNFVISNNNIKSLKHSPKHIGGNFKFDNNLVKSFYFLSYVGGNIICHNNPIYNIWKYIKENDLIDYFNMLNIITKDNKIRLKKLNVFFKNMNIDNIDIVDDYLTI